MQIYPQVDRGPAAVVGDKQTRRLQGANFTACSQPCVQAIEQSLGKGAIGPFTKRENHSFRNRLVGKQVAGGTAISVAGMCMDVQGRSTSKVCTPTGWS